MARVTVLMPTYNVAPYVREAIDSVLQQTYRDFELLVMDDCSTDETVDIVRNIADPRIRIVQNESNLGLAENLNRGLNLTKTEYVSRMDGDDIALPHWLQSEVEFLDTHPEVGVCGGGAQRFGTSQSIVRLPEWHDDIVANMLFECSILVPTVRMSVVREHGLRYRPESFPAEDYRFWADCLRVTQLHNIPDTLFRYRMHPTQICSARQEEQKKKVAEVQHYMQEWHGNSKVMSHKLFIKRQQIQYLINKRIPRKIHNLFHPKRGEVWMLHRVVEHRSEEPSQRRLEVTPDWLEQRILECKRQGINFVSIEEMLTSRHSVCITLDDGYHDNLTLALPLFRKLGIPFTVYVTTGFLDNRHPMWWYPGQALALTTDELRTLDADPLCTIGAHTVSHPLLSTLPMEKQRNEITQCKYALESILGHPVLHFSYPHGDYNNDTIELCRQAGFRTAVTTSGRTVRTDTAPLHLDRINIVQP